MSLLLVDGSLRKGNRNVCHVIPVKTHQADVVDAIRELIQQVLQQEEHAPVEENGQDVN